jgi:hypothetical protein
MASGHVRCAGWPRGNLWDPPGSPPCGWAGPLTAASLDSPPRCPGCGGTVELTAEDADPARMTLHDRRN